MKRLTAIFLSVIILLCSLCSCRRLEPMVIVPQKEIAEDEYVRLAQGVSKDMTKPEYWQKEEYDTTVMTLAQIKKFNSENSKLISTETGGNIALTDYKNTIDGDIVRDLLDLLPIEDEDKELYVNSQRVGSEYWYNLEQNIDKAAVPSEVNVKFGFSTVRATLRQFPTADYANDEIDDLYYDKFIMSDYMPFQPLVILHESKDGEWYFVSMYGYSGWIQKEYTAVCKSKSDWLERQNPDSFLVVTGKEIRLQEDPYCKELALQLVPMGTKMELISSKEAPERVNSRNTYGNYVVKLPIRLADGSVSDGYTLIPSTADVTVGYMPYTVNNLISQSLKLQGDAYGWAGSFHSNDCSGIIREIFLCFGIEMPRTATQQMLVKGVNKTDVEGSADIVKMETLKNTSPGALLFFKGHIMIYLGMDGDEPYVISSVGSISTSELKTGEYINVNDIMITSMLRTLRKNGVTWLTSLEEILVIQN